jgi:hypothetical protein
LYGWLHLQREGFRIVSEDLPEARQLDVMNQKRLTWFRQQQTACAGWACSTKDDLALPGAAIPCT